jgi:hypothetical protein
MDHVVLWMQTIKARDFNVTIRFVITQKNKCLYTILKQMPHWLTIAVSIQKQVTRFNAADTIFHTSHCIKDQDFIS